MFGRIGPMPPGTRWPASRAASGRLAARPEPLKAAWTIHDLVWERCQEEAALAARAGEVSAPPRQWARALELAERWFPRGDPRLATSHTNHAIVLRRQGRALQGDHQFAGALEVWDESWRWLAVLQSPGGDGPRAGTRPDHAAALARPGR